MTAPLILVVEDEHPQAEMLRYNLEASDFRVILAQDGEQGLLLAREHLPDLVVLDWMLPKVSGIALCRQLRADAETRAIAIIMVTARGEEADRIRGLDTGADDYIVKPYSPSELISRIRAVIRRTRPALGQDRLDYRDLSIDLETHKVWRSGKPVHLGPKEFDLLTALMEKPGRVLTREQLLDRVWGRDIHVEVRTVDVHVRRLRRALNAGEAPDLIRTVRGVGYALDADDHA